MTGKNQNMFFSVQSRVRLHEPFVPEKPSRLHAPFLSYRTSSLLESAQLHIIFKLSAHK
jgi:hypothetical protein